MPHWSEDHSAQVLETATVHGFTRHLKVRRRDGKDGISWDTLQAIKDELLGEEVLAVEIYPPANQVVNEANIRHLWEVYEGVLPFGLRR